MVVLIIMWSKQPQPIEHTFKIDKSFAKELTLAGQYKYIKASINYLTSDGDAFHGKTSKADKLLAKIGFDWKEYLDTVFSYTKSTTSGNAKGFDESFPLKDRGAGSSFKAHPLLPVHASGTNTSRTTCKTGIIR